MEIAFDGVQASPRYPGGLALRFARVLRYRPDKQAAEADTIDAVRAIWAVRGRLKRAHRQGYRRIPAAAWSGSTALPGGLPVTRPARGRQSPSMAGSRRVSIAFSSRW